MLFADPGGVQGPDGAPAEHAGSSQCHAEVQGDYTAGDPSGQCEPISLMCAFVRVCVCACCETERNLFSLQITVSDYDDQRKDINTMYNRITLRQLQRMAPSVSTTH